MMASKHAFLSASGSPYWVVCEVKPWREKGVMDITSKYAEEGIKAHALLEEVLKTRGYLFPVALADVTRNNPASGYLAVTLKLITEVAQGSMYTEVMSEQSLSISHITGEKGARGTADVIITDINTITIIDLKYGKNLRVDAEENTQLLIYGAAALRKYGKGKNILRMLISQPRMNHVSEWILTAKEVAERIKIIRATAKKILAAKGGENLLAVPGTKQCQFCRAKAECPERASFLVANPTVRRRRTEIEKIVFSNLDDEEYLEASLGLSLKET